MKITLEYDGKLNSFALDKDNSEGLPEGTVTAKSYCGSSGFLPTRIVIEIQAAGVRNEPVPEGKDHAHKPVKGKK